MSFADDLKIGEDAENEFIGLLEKYDWNTGRNTSKTVIEKRFYDLWAQKPAPKKAKPKTPRPVITFEIKNDRRVKETGNVYLEHETIKNSRADYIVYKLDTDGKFYLQERGFVLNLLDTPQFKQVSGGDRWGIGTLIPEKMFVKMFVDAEKAFS